MHRVVSLLLVAAVLTGCGDEGEEAATTTTTTRPTTTTTDPFAVPDEIDAAYVQRVLTEHERVLGDAYRLAMEAGEVTTGVEERVRALYTEDGADAELQALGNSVERNFAGERKDRGDRSVRIESLTSAADHCVAIRATYRFDLVLEKPIAPAQVVIELRGLDPKNDPVGHNQTGWMAAQVPESEAAELCDA